MSISASATIVRFPFAGVPAYASPNPEGIAVAHIDVTGDATGGTISGGFLSIGQFLYRLEIFQGTRSDTVNDEIDYVTFHQWAQSKSGFSVNAFDLNWHALRNTQAAFTVWTPREIDRDMIRRFPMGRTDNVGASNVLFYQNVSNADTIIYDFDLILTYWRKEALLLPGFLQAFFEAPFVPGGVGL